LLLGHTIDPVGYSGTDLLVPPGLDWFYMIRLGGARKSSS
jgi:hypothetical protein